MTEPKRLPFTTLNSSEKEKTSEKDPPTVRFTLSLDVTSDQLCNEFSYADLLKKSLVHEDGNDPFGEDGEQEALEAIAKKFEEKYNPKNTKWKKKHGRIQDLVDLGDGYDENDDFIDNSEAYDEVVPACLTTKLGGFYINCGKLDFKEISDDSDDDFKLGTLKKKKKKRRIESESESDGEKKGNKIKKRKLKEGVENGEKKKKKMMNGEGKSFKKPKNPDKLKKKMSPTVTDLLKQQSESTAGGDTKENGRITPDGHSQSSQDGNTSSQDEAMDSVIDSVIAMSRDDKLAAVFDSVIGMTDSNSRDNEEKKPESAPKLPEGLKQDFMDVLDKLKQHARCSSVGKGKFFSNEVNEMLLEVELTTRQIPCSQRSAIFGHLAWFLPCTKDTLLKRAKKLRLNRQDDQLKGPTDKLKDAIAAVMPEQIKRHETEVIIWKQKQAENDANKEETKPEGGKDGDTEDSEEEVEKTNTEQPAKKKVAAPKKKFEWNENLRVLLCDVVRVKMKIYDYMKTRTQTAEEYLRTFLDGEIKILWPKGWMQVSALFKESRPAHVAWTNPPKIKKVPVLNKTSNSTANTPVGSVKQGITPQPGSLLITKQGVAPASAPAGSLSQKSSVSSNTPVRPLAAGDGSRLVPTLLDYAGEKATPTQSKSLAEKVAKESTGNANNSASSLGLSILASSAATQKYMSERSWDHVVSDILRQTENKKDSSYLQQFQNYASTVFQHQLSREDGNKTSPTKSQVSPSSQQSLLQIKPQDAQNMVQKLKAAQMPKQTPPQAHQKQITQNQLAAFLSQKASPGSSALSNQEAFKQFLEGRDRQFTPSQVSGDAKAKNVATRPVNKVKTIFVQGNSDPNNSLHGKVNAHKLSPPSMSSASTDSSKKPVLVRSISQGSGSMVTSNQAQGQKISPTSNISVQRVSPQASTGIQRQSPSKSNVNYHNQSSLSNLSNTSKGEATATNLLQSLFGQIDQHARQKSPSPSASGVINRSTPPQNKSSTSPIWSMTSIVQSQTGSVPAKTSPTYAMPGLPKPVPGYQSIKLSSLSRDSGVPVGLSSQSSATMKNLLHTNLPQGIAGHTSSGYVPTSSLLPGQQGNSVQHQAGFFPPYTTQQSTYSYGSYYTGKSSNAPHGY